MNQPKLSHNLFFIFLFATVFSYAQIGRVSGVIEDANKQPLPGVSIVIKGTNSGTQTDFDGNYRIKCEVGDVLVISYIGQKTREVKVTAALFGDKQITTAIKKIAVKPILDTTYQAAIRKQLPSFSLAPNIQESKKTYLNGRYLQPSRIKNISNVGNTVKLTYFTPDVYFEVGINSHFGIQFVQAKNLPQTQNTYVQGIPFNGENTHFGPDTDLPFSYGPTIENLEFDGSNYLYDPNGKLVTLSTGNGYRAKVYSNNPYASAIKTSNNLFFNVSGDNFYGFDFLNTTKKDLYGREHSTQSKYSFNFNNSENYDVVEWNVFLKYICSSDNQPNNNGFQNNLLYQALATPISFKNNQEIFTANDFPSFSSSKFNNPEALLNGNRNQISDVAFLGVLKNKFRISDAIQLKSKFSYSQNSNNQQFGLYKNTIGFSSGYSSDKVLDKDSFSASVAVDWNSYINNFYFDIISKVLYTNENFDYRLSENEGFSDKTFKNAQDSYTSLQKMSRSTFRWYSRFNFTFLEQKGKFSIINNSFASAMQNSKWFLPTFQVSYNFAQDWYSDFISKLILTASLGYDVNYLNLFYNNQSHNSLELTPSQSLSYTANNDLFASNDVDLEEKRSYEVGMNMGFKLFEEYWNFEATYFNNVTEGSVFPIFENNDYQLQNIANVSNYGIEMILDLGIYHYSDFRFFPKIIFSTYDTKVLDILHDYERVPIAGFTTVSKNLIVGESAGVLLGTAYARDKQNNVIIDTDGFPLVANAIQIIGDPTPDFNIGFSSRLKWKGILLELVLDYQKGGDIWNGTQNVLNYLGRSQQSEREREITGFVFQGVNQQGQTNTIPVDFANPQNGLSGNRFVRYGFEGVAEEAIVDGSYFNFKSVNLSYQFSSNSNSPFFRELLIGLYGNNLFTASKFKGATPYNTLYDQASSQGLNFFNTPLISEVGILINIKI